MERVLCNARRVRGRSKKKKKEDKNGKEKWSYMWVEEIFP